MANVVAACTPLSPAKALLGTLKHESRALFEITEDFVRHTARLKIVSFYEMEMTGNGMFKRMVRPR